MLMIRKVRPPEPVGPSSIYKHDIPDEDLRQAKASPEDFFNGRLHEAHVIRLHGSYVVFSKNEPLPPGGFSDNYVGIHSRRGYVAVKRLRTMECHKRDTKARCQWTQEADIEKEVRMAKRVGLHAAPYFAVQTNTKAYIISPLFESDAMYLAGLGESRFPRAMLAYRFLRDVSTHLKHVHAQGIVHNDVKPNNVLVARKADDLEFVLCDYGLSCSFDTPDYPGGNAWYGAPEETLDFSPQALSDVFSLGLSCMTLINNSNPFDSVFAETKKGAVSTEEREVIYNIFEAVRVGKPCGDTKYKRSFTACWDSARAQLPEALIDIIKAMMAYHPKDRISTDEILSKLALAPPDEEVRSSWRKGVNLFKPGAIANAKRQARVIEQALINRGRLVRP